MFAVLRIFSAISFIFALTTQVSYGATIPERSTRTAAVSSIQRFTQIGVRAQTRAQSEVEVRKLKQLIASRQIDSDNYIKTFKNLMQSK